MKKSQAAPKVKVLWISPPSFNIYPQILNETGRQNLKLDLLAVFPETTDFVKKNIHPTHFRIVYLKTREYNKVLFFPWLVNHVIIGKSLHDFPSNVSFLGFKELADKEKPDLVILNEFYNIYSLQVARYCQSRGIPFILQTEMQRFNSSASSLVIKAYFRMFRKVLFMQPRLILPWTANSVRFCREYLPIPKNERSKIKLLPPGIDLKVFHRMKAKAKPKESRGGKERGKSRDVLRLLIVSRFVQYKRHVDLLKALAFLKEKDKRNAERMHLSIVRGGPLEKEVRRNVEDMGVSDMVTFLDRLPSERLKEVYAAHDALVLPSYNEAIGMVVPEAMACGLPAIVSDTCGATTYVKDGYNGFVFRTYDFKELAEKILLLSDKRRLESFGRDAEKHIRKNFAISVIGKLFNSYIYEAIRRKADER